MQFGVDDNGNRILPFPSGKSQCQVCKGMLIAKCGTIYQWHWQHYKDRNCDSWKEHETPWHRAWKEKFPKDWREVVIEKYNEKHIADVKTHKGIVIEFQNSSISSTTIAIREDFYGDMVWIINAKNFKDNLTIWSIVTAKLNEIEKDSWQSTRSSTYSFDQELKDYDTKIFSLQSKIDSVSQSIAWKKGDIVKLEKSIHSLEILVDQAIESWDKKNQYGSYPSTGLSTLSTNLREDFIGRKTAVSKLEAELKSKRDMLERIQSLSIYHFEGINYVIVEYDNLNAKNYQQTIAVLKESKNTIFPDVKKLGSQNEFFSIQYRTQLYEFYIDPTETINRTHEEINILNQYMEEQVSSLPNYRELLLTIFQKYLDEELKKEESNLNKNQEELMYLQLEKSLIETERMEYQDEQEQIMSQMEAECEEQENKDKLNVMKKFKGKYGFRWKNERKSWANTTVLVFFDVGKDYLFERIGMSSLRKVTIVDFLTLYHS